MQKVYVTYAVLINVSLSQEASYILEQGRFAKTWHTVYLNDVIALAQQPQDIKHILVTTYKRTDFIG